MTEFPSPPIPADVDLRDYPYTPIYRSRLFGSDFHALSSDAGWRAGLTLWLKSWDQIPAGSLPNDEMVLCRLAELGNNVKAWRRIAEEALHGWSQCNDGRLYHKVVTECVTGALNFKIASRERTTKARAQRQLQRLSQTEGNAAVASPSNHTITPVTESVTDVVTESVTHVVTESVTSSNLKNKDNKKERRGETRTSSESLSENPETHTSNLAAKNGSRSVLKDEFNEVFWPLVPRKADKGHAERAFVTARKEASLEQIIDGVEYWTSQCQGKEKQFIPMPATWLNGKRWLDERSASTTYVNGLISERRTPQTPPPKA